MTKIEQMVEQVAESYNSFPYDSHAFKWCSPAYIRAAAYLYGVDLPPVQNARVLEIGCASGGNSLPFAFMYPEAEIVAIDISEAQIAQGQDIVKRAQLSNISMHTMCMTELPNDLAPFDYVIAHGVLSWIPKQMQPQLFKAIQKSLSPNGGAYLSFNTYPGWRARETLRELMLWHSRDSKEIQHKVDKAREVIPFLEEGVSSHNLLQPAKEYLATQLPNCESQNYYLAHEYLELHNNPLYFKHMIDFAEQANLRYVGDAEPNIECVEYYQLADNAEFIKLCASASTAIEQQQYLDFAVGRSFRKSLLSSNQHPQQAFDRPDFSRLVDLLFAASFEALDDDTYTQAKRYQVLDKYVDVSCPIMQEMLALLQQHWPRPISGRDLFQLVGTKNQKQSEQALTQLFMLFPLEMSRSYEDLPLCLQDLYSGLIPGAATLMSARAEGSSNIAEFNAWYSSSIAEMDDAELFVIQQLDTIRNPWQVADALEQTWRQHKQLPQACQIIDHPEQQAPLYVQSVIDRLHKYAIYI